MREVVAIVQEELATLGLELNADKFRAWRPEGKAGMPEHAAAWWVDSLPCLGTDLQWLRREADADPRDTPVGAEEEGSSIGASSLRLRAFAARLHELAPHGLPLQFRLLLLRTYVNGAVTHKQRARRGRPQDWDAFDGEVVQILAAWLGGAFPPAARTLAFLPIRRGGLGFISAASRCDAAFLASWEMAADGLRAAAGAHTETQLFEELPALAEQVLQARAYLRSRGAPVSARRASGRQRQLSQAVLERFRRELLGSLGPVETAILDECSGPQGRAVLGRPCRPEHALSDAEMAVTLRRRLLYPDPGLCGDKPCGHMYVRAQTTCGVVPGPDFGRHALCCCVGAG